MCTQFSVDFRRRHLFYSGQGGVHCKRSVPHQVQSFFSRLFGAHNKRAVNLEHFFSTSTAFLSIPIDIDRALSTRTGLDWLVLSLIKLRQSRMTVADWAASRAKFSIVFNRF